jgi:hypothetical protein
MGAAFSFHKQNVVREFDFLCGCVSHVNTAFYCHNTHIHLFISANLHFLCRNRELMKIVIGFTGRLT